MSFEAMAWAVKQDLPVKQKITLLMLADRINKDTGRCHPSMAGLARDCGMSETSVKEAIRSLREAGLVVAHERRVGQVSLTNEYELPMCEIPTPPACDAPPPRRIAPHPPGALRPLTYKNNLPLEPDSVSEGLFSQADIAEAEKPDRFNEFWEAYPRKVAKDKAVKAWKPACKKADPDKIIAAAKRYAVLREGEDQQYTAHPASWLNAGRFNDDDLKPPPPKAQRYVYHPGGLEQ